MRAVGEFGHRSDEFDERRGAGLMFFHARRLDDGTGAILIEPLKRQISNWRRNRRALLGAGGDRQSKKSGE